MLVSEKLHKRLVRLGYNVLPPKRIWIGRSTSSDLWRWQAIERDGGMRWGAELSMSECVKISDAHLRALVDHN